jgi:hypothetical protein
MSEDETAAVDFAWCDVRWDGPGGVYDLGRGAEGHVCAQHKPGHEVHVCCCGANQPTAPDQTGGV